MMNRKLKQALSDAFYAPPPARKAAFLKQHRRRELGRWELIAPQGSPDRRELIMLQVR